MKSMIYQFYNEGFATTFLLKPTNYIKRKIKNKKLVIFICTMIKTLYTVLMLIILFFVIYLKFFYKK